ncbi:MAG TPA: Ig-like domain-containing protein, partial [Turneriella sp.]|nr:Ig-like domain-containing protein [Turneriella sp.]
MKRTSLNIFTLLTVIALAACGGSKGGEASSTGGGGGGAPSDTTPPTVGTAITFSGISDTDITVSWGAASDNVTSQANLQYRLVKATSSAAIDNVAEVDAITGVNLIADYTSALLTKSVTGLTASTTYHFAVVVKDTAGNKAIYAPQSQATAAAGTTASPTFNPTPGAFNVDQNLVMASATSGATICYTDNGVTPACDGPKTGCTTGTKYTSAVVVSTTQTYKALACKAGNTDSSETSGTFTVDKTAPTIASTTPADAATSIAENSTIAVTFSEAMDVSTIKSVSGTTTCDINSQSIQVSLDNFATCIGMTSATPSTSDNTTFTMTPAAALQYNTTYMVRVKTLVKDAVGNALTSEYAHTTGFKTGLGPALTINNVSPGTGTYSTTQSVSVTSVEGGAVICYTTDGNTPATSAPGTCSTGSQINEGASIPISDTATLKILLTKVGHSDSAVSSYTYTFPPKVTSTSPADGTPGFDPTVGKIDINFNRTMSRASASFNTTTGACTGNIQVSADDFTTCIGITIPAGDSATLSATAVALPLPSVTTYKVKIENTLKSTAGDNVQPAQMAIGVTTRYYRIITIDGADTDWSADELVMANGGAGLSWAVTWDSANFYLRLKDKDFKSDLSARLDIYFDTTPGFELDINAATDAKGTEYAF